MKVLVTVGSKYGAAREVGKAIAGVLVEEGFEAEYLDCAEVLAVTPYDAVVLGSAVYGGLWRRDAEDVVKNFTKDLKARDVWTFSVGIETVVQEGQPKDEAYGFAEKIKAHEHRRFTGALNPDKLNVGERALIRALDPPLGDFRDFAEIRDWARSIAAQLREIAAL